MQSHPNSRASPPHPQLLLKTFDMLLLATRQIKLFWVSSSMHAAPLPVASVQLLSQDDFDPLPRNFATEFKLKFECVHLLNF